MADTGSKQPIDLLAEFLTGGEVGFHSVGLGMPEGSSAHTRAKRFFALREALGVRGYADETEAKARLVAALGESRTADAS